jgi:GT2 family glycosyltransferase
VLAFTDDDVLVEDDWLAAIRAAMADPEVGLVGGPVLPLYEGRVPDWLDLEGDSGFGRLAAPLALLHYGPTRSPLGQRVALGANMAVRRDVFEGVGGFPADLGKLRGTLLSGEDHEVCERVQAAGFAAVYDPSIRVRHFVPADRLRVRYFLRWFFWSGVTNAALDRARPAHDPGRRLLGAPAYILRQLGVASAATAGSLLRASWSGAADHATRAAFAAGYVWASWKVRFGRRPVSAARRPMEAA